MFIKIWRLLLRVVVFLFLIGRDRYLFTTASVELQGVLKVQKHEIFSPTFLHQTNLCREPTLIKRKENFPHM
jgi:hypothetical protein